MIKSRIVASSVNPQGCRLTTYLTTYPRFIHAEVMTHRGFSRNAASSRATPIEKMIAAVNDEPAWPERWGAKGKGMQDGGILREEIVSDGRVALDHLRKAAIDTVQILSDIGFAKQVANRYVEPWSHITVLITATHRIFTNFFKLRAHPAADPTFQALAYTMLEQYLASDPAELEWGEWHLPGLDPDAAEGFELSEKLKIATALAARTSYTAFDDGIDHAKAFEIHDVKLKGPPMHGSPFEHCAQASLEEYPISNFDNGYINRCGWWQYRKMIGGEATFAADLEEILASKPEWLK